MSTLNNIFIIKEQQTKRLGSYIYQALEITENQLFECENRIFSSYGDLNLLAFPLIKKNQVNKYIRENKSFFIKAEYKAYDKEQKEKIDYWLNDYYDLYLSESDIKRKEEKEEITEFEKGCKRIVKYYEFETTQPVFITRGSDLKLYKELLEIPNRSSGVETLEERKKEIVSYWEQRNPTKKAEIENAYNKALEKGYKLLAFVPSQEKECYIFTASLGVVRYEKDNQYKKVEKLTEEVNKFLYKDRHITTSQMQEILQHFNITKKRR